MVMLAGQGELQKQVSEHHQKINGFASIDHIDKLKNVFLPKFETFGRKIDIFMRELKDIRIGVQHIDGQLGIKANKAHLTLLEEKLADTFVTETQWRLLENEHRELLYTYEAALAKMQQKVDRYEQDLAEKTAALCKQQINDNFQQYEKVRKDF